MHSSSHGLRRRVHHATPAPAPSRADELQLTSLRRRLHAPTNDTSPASNHSHLTCKQPPKRPIQTMQTRHTAHRKSTTDHRPSPIANRQPIAANRPSPTAHRQPPIANHPSPTTRRQPPVAHRQPTSAPVARHRRKADPLPARSRPNLKSSLGGPKPPCPTQSVRPNVPSPCADIAFAFPVNPPLSEVQSTQRPTSRDA
jgi:hypothetical protein